MKKVILTGDRPSGPLHLGHYVGSLMNRAALQDEYQQYIIIADMQALTDHFDTPQKLHENVYQVALDYLSVGIDPQKSVIFLQSLIRALSEMTMYFLNLVTWNRLKHNPTVKSEIEQKKFLENTPAGFMIYPVSQAADIIAFQADLVPVGEDQLPMMEQTHEIVRKFNTTYKTNLLKEPKALIPLTGSRLIGTDGQAKMSKSQGNAIYLSDTADDVAKKVKGMYTDPNHLRVEDPGKVEGNPIFIYLDIFAKDKKRVNELKEHYQRGGLGDVAVKKELSEVLNAFLDPIRKKRKELENNKEYIHQMILEGSEKAGAKAEHTLQEIKKAIRFIF